MWKTFQIIARQIFRVTSTIHESQRFVVRCDLVIWTQYWLLFIEDVIHTSLKGRSLRVVDYTKLL